MLHRTQEVVEKWAIKRNFLTFSPVFWPNRTDQKCVPETFSFENVLKLQADFDKLDARHFKQDVSVYELVVLNSF